MGQGAIPIYEKSHERRGEGGDPAVLESRDDCFERIVLVSRANDEHIQMFCWFLNMPVAYRYGSIASVAEERVRSATSNAFQGEDEVEQ